MALAHVAKSISPYNKTTALRVAWNWGTTLRQTVDLSESMILPFEPGNFLFGYEVFLKQ
jgi:hypothetical protein